MSVFESRPVGRTQLKVSVFGQGGAPLGGNLAPTPWPQAEATLDFAWESGIRFYDTAPFYGYGLSEHYFGNGLRKHNRDDYVLSTKVGRLLKPRTKPQDPKDPWKQPLPFEPVFDYGYDAVMRSFEDSLQRLGLDRIDILLIHDIGATTHFGNHAPMMKQAMEGGYKALKKLRDEGLIGALGMGVNEWEVCMEAMQHGDFDTFLLAGRYTLLEQEALTRFLPECRKRGTTIIIGGPFNSGILAVGAKPGVTYNYEPAPKEILEKVAKIEKVCADHKVPLPAAALQFPLTHPSICSVIPGSRNVDELKRNLDLFRFKIPAALWSDLKTAGLMRQDAPTPK
jgi:D-threo-aldose 1-dehydrogenase